MNSPELPDSSRPETVARPKVAVKHGTDVDTVESRRILTEPMTCTDVEALHVHELLKLFFAPETVTGELRTSDYGLQLPIAWIRFHHVPRMTLYAPDFTSGGPTEEQLGTQCWSTFVQCNREDWIGTTHASLWKIGEETQTPDDFGITWTRLIHRL